MLKSTPCCYKQFNYAREAVYEKGPRIRPMYSKFIRERNLYAVSLVSINVEANVEMLKTQKNKSPLLYEGLLVFVKRAHMERGSK